MRFAIASEGRTDYTVLKNLLIGFFKDKSLPVTLLRPKEKEPFGWGNLLNYISSQDFRDDCDDENIDYTIIQIDTNECADWNEALKHIGDNTTEINNFISQVTNVLIKKIGNDFYAVNKDKIIFAICVHEVECWLLPFNTNKPAHYSKMVGCVNTIEQIANRNGYSIHEKNYQDGKHYDTLSKEMKNNKVLIQKGSLNPSLKLFLESLTNSFQHKIT